VGLTNPTPPSDAIAALEYLRIVLVFLILRRSEVSENQWLYFPDRDLCFNRGYEPRRFWDDPNSPRDRTLLSLEITARAGAEILTASDQEVTDLVVQDIARTGLIKREDVEKSIVARLPFGYPLYDCLADSNAQRVFDYVRQWPGLVTTGRQGLFSHNNMDHSMHMGLESARALAAGPEGLNRWYDRADELRHFRIVD
jgi:protoporphyrinogen oxidase